MIRRALFLSLAFAVLSVLGCLRQAPEGVVKAMIEPHLWVSHPLYYWETHNGNTAVYRIREDTSDISCIMYGLDAVHEVKSSKTAVYILREDRRGHAALTRLESDRRMVTEARLEHEITPTGEDHWFVTRDDVMAIAGEHRDGANRVILVSFTREEPEETFRPRREVKPTITWKETEWLSSSDPIGPITLSPDGRMAAMGLPLEGESDGYGLFIINEPGDDPARIGEYPLAELGAFSPDGRYLLASFEIEGRVDLFLITVDSWDIERLTTSPRGYRVGSAAWHPSGRHFIYATDYTTEFKMESTPLSDQQLCLYSIDSMNDRRLTAFQGMSLWVDFAPNGDFLMYSSTRGVFGRGTSTDESKGEGQIETWRLSFVAWDSEKFTSGNPDILMPDEVQLLVTWTIGTEQSIGFCWGPGGEWDPTRGE